MAGLLWPIAGHHTTQRFAGEHPFEPALFLATDGVGPRRARSRPFPGGVPFKHVHGAIDISCPIGTKVFAPEGGTIVAANRYSETGENFLMLQIRPGTILFFTHLDVADLDKFRRKVGRHVKRGQVIAHSGNTGMSTGPHLHWEVRVTTNPDADVDRSWRWFKWNPRRLRVGGDLAGMLAILPVGAEPEPAEDDDDPPEMAGGPIVETPDPAGDHDPLGGPPEAVGNVALPFEVETDPDPVDPPLNGDDRPDEFGDAAAVVDRVASIPHLGGQ
jgi:murein DD-endopeptidase MepM/ murein hydrolase activator NlpD